MNRIIAYLITGILLVTTSSCEDECEAGLGGNVTIAAFPKHHDDPIFSQANYPDSAFVKFNTQEFPGEDPADYDLVLVGTPGEDHIHIEGLKCGDYFIFMTGFDTAINDRVVGGIPYSFDQSSGEIDVVVPVTE